MTTDTDTASAPVRALETSEFEFGLIIASNALNRWIVRCMAAAGVADLSALAVLVLHSINHRGRTKKLADLCFVLNVGDTHLVVYALKKLSGLGLIEGSRKGKERFYATTAEGREVCATYRRVRKDCLMASFQALGLENADVGELTERLRVLSGLYDQAARGAASL